jgi:hypothetical protein
MTPAKQRYVLIRGQIYRWEEKEPFVSSKCGPLGAIEYDRESDSLRCHECGEWRQWLGRHIARFHSDVGVVEYKSRHGLRAGVGLIAPRANADFAARPSVTASRIANGERLSALHKTSLFRSRKGGFLRGNRGLMELRNERGTCDAQLLFKLKQYILLVGHVPLGIELPQELHSQVVARFGRLSEALARLEIDPNKEFRTVDFLIEDLRDFYVLNRRLPRPDEWGTGRLAPLLTYMKFFGNVANCCDFAGLGRVWEQEHCSRPLLLENAADSTHIAA